MKKLFLAAALTTAFALTACGGGGDDPAQVASANTTLAVNATTGPTVARGFVGESFAFSGGVPAFGTTGATTVALSAPAAGSSNPGFTIGSGSQQASGVLEFGSCRFRVTSSTFSGVLATNNVVTIEPCAFTLNTAGTPADGTQQTRTASLVLGTTVSAGTTVDVVISPTGQLTVNGSTTGTVTLAPVTGG